MAAPKEGIGTTVTFGTTSFSANLVSVSWDGAFGREDLETSYMGTTTARTFIPSTLYDAGNASLTFQFGSGVSPSTLGGAAAETITINFGGENDLSASGYCNSVSFAADIDEIMEATFDIKFSGAITEPA